MQLLVNGPHAERHRICYQEGISPWWRIFMSVLQMSFSILANGTQSLLPCKRERNVQVDVAAAQHYANASPWSNNCTKC